MNGSSLPHCSGLPVDRNFSWRAFDRWTASSIISGVAVVRGTLTVVVDVEVVVDVDIVDVIVSWAVADKPAMAYAAAKSMPAATAHFKGVCTCLILSSVDSLCPPIGKCTDQVDVLGSPSGRISGVVKNTPSGVGFGVGVTATCGPTLERSWYLNSIAKSSCTVLWQWLT